MAAEPGAAQTLRECRNAARLNDTKSEGEENGNSKAEKGEAEHQEASTCQDQVNADDSKVCFMSTSRTIQGTHGLRRPVVILVALILVAVACRKQEVDYGAADVRLAQVVRTQLDASPHIKGAASRVAIKAKDGTVTLTGTVDTIRDKATVEQVVAQINGVRNVVNQVTVNVPVLPVPDEPFEERAVRAEAASNGERIGPSSEDARIYHAVRRQLVKREATPKPAIFVDVEDGDVTLRGTIFTTAARDEAVASARKVEGVNAVRDLLVVNTELP